MQAWQQAHEAAGSHLSGPGNRKEGMREPRRFSFFPFLFSSGPQIMGTVSLPYIQSSLGKDQRYDSLVSLEFFNPAKSRSKVSPPRSTLPQPVDNGIRRPQDRGLELSPEESVLL